MNAMKPIWPWALFLPYLAYYSYFEKFLAAPPDPMTFVYVLTTGLIVAMSAIIPFLLSWTAIRRFSSLPERLLIAAIAPLALCAMGYALYWLIIIAPNPNLPVPLAPVVARALTPGLVMAVILASWAVLLTLSRGDADRAST